MASMTAHHLALLLLAAVALPAAMSACADEAFPSGRTYVTCEDLPSLGAALHWTYDASGPSISLAFVATPAAPGGWVAWGINPTGTGMVGAQALVALAGDVGSTASSPSAVRTYNLTGYTPLGKASTPIAFSATRLASDLGSGGKLRLYATLQLHRGMKTKVLNHVWQVGSTVTRGAPDMHAMDPENLAAMGKFVLSDGATANPPAPAGGPSSSGDGSSSRSRPTLSRPVSRAADTTGVSAPAIVVLAVLGFFMVG